MPLYRIEDESRPAYVYADGIEDAIVRWREAVASEGDIPTEEVREPKGAHWLAEDEDVIFGTEGWVA